MLFLFISYLCLFIIGVSARNTPGSTNETFIVLEVAKISTCGTACLLQTIPQVGCSLTNITCQCESDRLVTITTKCMLTNCTLEESLELSNVQAKICELPNNSRNPGTRVLTIVVIILCYGAILLRLVCRFAMHRKFSIDDWLMMGVGVIDGVASTYGMKFAYHGYGNHIWNINDKDVPDLLHWFYISELVYLLSLGLIKVSILSFYLSIFPGERFRIMCWVTLVFCTMSTIALTLATMFQCYPIHFAWDTNLEGSKCFNENAIAWAGGAINIFQDIIIVGLPVHELWFINLNLKKKIGLITIFGLGFFVCIASMVRLNSLKTFSVTADPTWDDVPTTLWSALENTAALLCANLPMIRAGVVCLYNKIYPAKKENLEPSYEVKGDSDLSGRPKHKFASGYPIDLDLESFSSTDIGDEVLSSITSGATNIGDERLSSITSGATLAPFPNIEEAARGSNDSTGEISFASP